MKRIFLWPVAIFVIVIIVIIFVFASPQLYKGSFQPITQLQSSNSQPAGQNGFMPIGKLLSKDCTKKCEALVFVENGILNPLKSSINTWKKDVEKEFNANVVIIPVEEKTTPEEIKDTMWSYENKGDIDVFAVLFVGEIPYLRAYISGDNDRNYMAQGFFPSDVLFVDQKNRCSYNSNIHAYNMSGFWGCDYTIDEWPFVIGRLKPYGDKATRISLIKKYFDRNHAHRISSNNYGSGNGKLLVNITQFDGVPDGNELINTEKRRLSWLLPFSQFRFLSPLTNSNDTEYLRELKKNYSAVYFNGHGAPIFHQYNITPAVLKQTKPAALYYSLKSCSVGDISETDNIASHYLFDGNGLFVYSNSIPVFSGHPIDKDIYYLMSGVPIYKYYSKFLNGNYTAATILMGDPTLSIRKQNSSGQVPDVKIKPYDLDFGKISLAGFTSDFLIKESEWLVANNSNKPIYIDEMNIRSQFIGDSYNDPNAIQVIPRLKGGYSMSAIEEPFSTTYGVKVEANSNANGTILFELEKNGIMTGGNPYRKFKGMLAIPVYSGESDQIYILDIPFKGEIVQ